MVDRSASDCQGYVATPMPENYAQAIVEVDAEQPVNGSLEVLAAELAEHYVDRQGRRVGPVTVLSCWQRYFMDRARSLHDWPWLIAGRHLAPPPLGSLQRLSGESVISAEAFIILATTAGLFNDGMVKRHPRTSDPCEVSFHSFVKRDYIVRHAAESDLERLCELEKLCWQHTRSTKRQIRARLQKYPRGQFVLEKGGEVLGVIYSQRIANEEAIETRTATNVHELHDPSGSIVQLLAVNIDPRVQNVSYGDQLLELMLQRCSLMTGVTKVVGVTLCKSYRAEDGRSFEDYIRQQGSGRDAILAFHEAHGAEIVKVIQGYRPQDSANLHNGVLVVYDILNRTPRRHTVTTDADVRRTDQPQIGPFVQTEAATLLGIRGSEIDIDRPLMEMGLDSADLLKLQRHCETEFGLKLHAGFFFEYSSLRKVIEYLTARLAPVPAAAEVQQVSTVEEETEPAVSRDEKSAVATDIAIIGMSCRLPGGIETPDQLWQVLASEQCVTGSFPRMRGDWPAAADYAGIDRGGFVHHADAFDAAFFRISPAEAQITDPQQRMLLELAWACLEDAGVLPAQLKGSKTGVFVGASNCDYSRLVQEAGLEIEAHHGVGSSLAILANRISYFFDFSGPSMVVDTACSSSLVALHTAAQSLRSGECSTAIASGVNLICHPDLSIAYHKAGMLAPDGRCKVFDARADGYVRSEGAVVLLLKPLRAAIADRNRIHAVIRGSAINHGGLAGGLTVPNPQKQKELLVAAWNVAGIVAQDLTYIEAHGTGTSLGDPIEIQGIQAAYEELASGNPSRPCAIGSVKSNLGHLESAAGITGLLKVILSLQHRELPASVNFSQLNPRIRLQETPFVIQERLGAWDAKPPRIAAVSSFGSGGTNAHVVVQEYSRTVSSSRAGVSHLFVSSAASEDRLRACAADVIDWLERAATSANFADAIYTWQVGRTAMKHRLAIFVRDHVDLLNKLQQWLAGKDDVIDAWSGLAAQNDHGVNRVWRTKSGRRLIDEAAANREFELLGPLWTMGIEVDWRKCLEPGGWEEREPQIVDVPTYPFAKERYWIDAAARSKAAAATRVLHPLLHTNSSDLSQQSYSTTFSGEEFFLSDHQVRVDGPTAQKVLPAVAYLEMARAAIEHALPGPPGSAVFELRNTVWVQPIVVTRQKQVRLTLSANDEDEIDYEISSQDMDQEVVHCQGRAFLSAESATPVGLDLDELAGQMGEGQVEPGVAYAAFARMGLVYGPSFQGIAVIQRGSGQLLAHLRLPRAVQETSEDYVLHPSMMDGAVQAAVGLIGWSERSNEPRLPFALESLRVFAPCTREMAAWARYSPGSQPDDYVVKLDIDLCDERGNVCVQLHGFSSRGPGKENTTETLLTPIWQVQSADGIAGVEHAQHDVILCELASVNIEKLGSLLPQSNCTALRDAQERSIAQRYSDYALACFERIQAILLGRPQGRVLVHVVIADHEEQTLLAGLAGLLKTAALENPQLVGKLLLVSHSTTAEDLGRQLQEEKAGALDTVVRYEQGVREVLRWQPVVVDQEKPPVAFKDAGVYLVTGGLGGLGLLFTKEMIEQARDVRVVLTGRSAPSAEKQSVLDGLSGGVVYRQLDPGNLDEVAQLIAAITEEYGQLSGILHCAGMIADNFILKKDAPEFSNVLAPKVAGTFNLDEASRNIELDFFVLFSSIAGATGNLGQADYATANAFMDQFAAFRNRQVKAGQRHGRTRSINWPLWQAGGMGNDPATRELLQLTTGMQPMQTATGLEAFYRSLSLPYDQILVVEGDPAQMRRALAGSELPPQPPAEQPVVEIERGSLTEKTQEFLRKQLSNVLKMPAHTIDPQVALEEYGIDSIMAMKLTNQLEETFGSLPKTLFFEYRTIPELTEYFISQHSAQLSMRFAATASRTGDATPEAARALPPGPTPLVSNGRFSRPRSAGAGPATESDRIAIIGLSGRYPEAVNVEAYWHNLSEGKDCIIEVPIERWDWRAYFSADRSKSGRHYSKWGGFIEGVDEFDPLFFNISPREAKYLDPQERLFLQHAWMAVEDAGYTRASLQVSSRHDLAGQVGVYAGVMYSEYQLFGAEASVDELRMGFAGNLASIANRVSYVLNLHGPSMTLDTMCSSSLTAIHVACQDLNLGRTSMAIAGGVNVSIHPNKYLMLSIGQFISSDGHCQSFGEGGDGYIPGEGVGVVVLKRLSEARRDGDHIYGVIRGSALNHGGKTNGYTVPNPQAQTSAISRALAESRIDARHISYIEAHGTGTKLGDPIEIAALGRAFQRDTNDTEFCLIGSAKSNIGHCESAAGIAGLTKVLLQMHHQQIVPSLHSAQLNPYIDFPRSPFVVNQTLRPWEQPVIDGLARPRIAGISSFGAGGSNAHMIIEEYQGLVSQPIDEGSVVILLSARTSEQLQQKVADLLDLVRARASTIDLVDMAYTLQVGREPMDERLGFLVDSVEQLAGKLTAYAAGDRAIEDAYYGQVKRNKEALAVFTTDADLQQAVDKWITARKFSKLLDLWVRGLELDWSKLYGEARPQRISLPTYPFAKERYWIEIAPRAHAAAKGATTAVLHPLLQSNTSDLSEQRYRSTFTGEEFFFVNQKELASVAYLEMARAAVEHALPAQPESAVAELRDVVWAQPLIVEEQREVDITLSTNGSGEIDFEIYSHEAEIVHCHGRAVMMREPAPAALDLDQLARSGQSLAQLRLPKDLEETAGDYVLHPSLMDSALRAAVGLIGGGPRLPSTIESLRSLSPCSREMVAWVRYSPGSRRGEPLAGLDVDLCDERGNVSAQLRGVRWQPEARKAPVAAAVRREIALVSYTQAALVSVERKKPIAISLAPPSALGASAPVSARRARISLLDAALGVSLQGSPVPTVSSVRLYDEGHGIFSIEIGDPAVTAHMVQALERVQQERSLRVLMLRGIERASGQSICQTLVSFPYPTIAVLHGDAIGAGFMAAALSDFMVCNEDARYGYTDADRGLYPTTAQAILFGERFGDIRAQDLLYRAHTSTGKQLRAMGWTCPTLPVGKVEAYAQQLASTLATKSLDALRLLKRHLTRRLVGLVEGLTAIDIAVAGDETAAKTTIATTERIRVDTPSSRVLAITFGIADAKDLVAGLGRIFAELQQGAWYKAIVLGSDDPEFLFAVPDDVVLDAQRLIGESKIPVVAALTRNAKGNAWLIAQFCDACVYSRDGVYSAANFSQSQTAAAVFAHRLGNEAANEILLTGADYSGGNLQQRACVLRVAERDHVMAAAVDIAARWVVLPRITLAAWKNHTAITLRQKIQAIPAAAARAQTDDTTERVDAAPVLVPLRSNVVTATVHSEGIVVVMMEDRKAKNMFSNALLEGVREAFAHIEQTPAYKVVILTGYDSYFASGGTKESLLAIQQGTAKFTDFDIYQSALDCKLPVIAAMQGHGLGAGWPMGMFADIVLLSEESQYLSPYMDYGFTPGAGATWVLPEKLGQDLARESLLTAQPYVGRELRERGVTLRVLPRIEVSPAAMALARQIAQASRDRLIGLKAQLTAYVRQPLEETYRLELAMHEKTFVGQSDTLAQIESKFQRQQAESPTTVPEDLPIAVANPSVNGDVLRAVSASLRTLLANELQMRESDLDEDKLFVELGLDSISGVTWLRKINVKYQTSIEATKIYSLPTLAQLSRYVKEEAEKKGTLPGKAAVPVVTVPVARVAERSATVKRTFRRGRAAAHVISGTPPPRRSQAIAVIGMAGQFPQANNLDEFWQNIAQGRNCITEVPRKRWDVNAWYEPGDPVAGKTNSQWAGTIDHYDRFDPLFFNISPTEAEDMDPQQRLFLQACWHSIENAGYDARRLSGSKCGVFVGCADSDYHQLSREHQLSAQGFTGSAMSILAARASYFLNLRGPSISIDTACSSSLVAIAQACDSLISGGSDLALAGGVYVMVGPEMHIKTAQAGMLSPEGRCFTFDQRADGFVPGEGVGVVLLKRIVDAERDGDIIHAVIQGWGLNQDGKTNGITAPNPESQTRLEQEVYDKYQIDPANIQLIEAHGTGTKLGDPIEVEGLRNAFRNYTQEKEYCALGSVKSNIGHCLAAAGIAGVIKLVMALKHQQLPPTINFERLNEHIDLKNSPFYVNGRLREWEPRGAQGRQAATSSFGFSGTNAHIVFGEYLPPADASQPVSVVMYKTKALIPLSARTAEQLQQKARDLLDFVRKEAQSIDLFAMAYTLQIGREAMEERLGVLAGSVEQLADKLEAYVRGEPEIDEVYRGQVKRGKETMGIISQDGDAKEAVVATWIAGGKLSGLLELWVDGLELDWNRLHGEVKPRRIVLPLYPFAKERYWIETETAGHELAAIAVIHPLLHSNTSDLSEQRYSSTFTGDEFFLTDHRVRTNGSPQKILPGAAYLEMARAAIQQVSPDQQESGIMELHDTVWLKPFVVVEHRRISIALSANDDGRVDYEIYSTEAEVETVHCQGHAIFRRQAAPARLDLAQLRSAMGGGRLAAPDLYALCVRMGLHYGLAHQGITAIHLGDKQLLADLRLPAVVEASENEYVLHPSMIDSALQASIGLIIDRNHVPTSPPVPFVVESVRILSVCAKRMTAWVRLAEGSLPEDRITKVDIDLCDQQGNVCVQMRGFASRILGRDVKAQTVTLAGTANHLLLFKEERSPFDLAFYQTLIADVVNRNVSVDEAVELG